MADTPPASAPAPAPAAPAPVPAAAPSRGIGVWTTLVAVVLVAILVLYAIAYTVPAGCVAVLKTFGEVRETVAEPGLHFKAPAPIQSVQIIDLRPRLMEIRNVELTMANQFNVHVMTTVGWQVSDPRRYITAVPNEAKMEEVIAAIVQDARQAVSMPVKLDDLVSTNPEQRANYARFEQRYLDTIRGNLDPAYGVAVTTLAISGLALPENATNTVQESMAAQRRAMAEKYKQEGETQAAAIKAEGETNAARLLADAEAEALEIRGEGDASAAEFYRVYTRSPEARKLARLFKSLDALEAAVRSSTVMLVPDTNELFRVLSSSDDGAAE